MAGSTYRRREAVVAVAVGELFQGRAKTVGALTGKRRDSTTRSLTQLGGNRFVRLSEEEIKRHDLRSGLVEHRERAGEEGARERPPAEACKAVVVDQDHHHFRARRANPAQPEPQVERRRLEPAHHWIIGKDSEHQHHEGGADQRQAGRAHAARQGHGGPSYCRLVRPMKSANSASVHTRAGTGSLPASTRAPQRAGMTTSRPVATLFRLTRPSSTPTCVDPGRASINQSVERTAATLVAVSTSKCGRPPSTGTTARSRPSPSDNLASRLSPPLLSR